MLAAEVNLETITAVLVVIVLVLGAIWLARHI